MKNKWSFFTLFLFVFVFAHAQDIRQISSREGISNNAILSLCQDQNGYIWAGTCDGLNQWDGYEMQQNSRYEGENTHLSGNLIEELENSRDNVFWVRTNYGLDKLDPKSKRVERHNDFQGLFIYTTRNSDEVFVISQDHKFYYYDKPQRRFYQKAIKGLNLSSINGLYFDRDNQLWFFSSTGFYCAKVGYCNDGADIVVGPLKKVSHPHVIESVYKDDSRIFFVDDAHILYRFDLRKKQIIYKFNLTAEMAQRGKISSVIQDKEDLLVAFLTNGVIRLCATPQNVIKYVVQPVRVNCGVFTLWKDRKQDIVWIGTDGQGLLQLSQNPIHLKSYTYDHFPVLISKPVRTLFVDKKSDLWIGTKDDGIIRIKDFYRVEKLNVSNTERITSRNSDLANNSVYALAPSRRNIFWIGGDGPGLNYYSYKDGKIHVLKSSQNIEYVHALQETSDSVLWIATVGKGIFKVILKGSQDYPEVVAVKPIRLNKELDVKNLFFTLYQENDSILWFGNRGCGSVRYNIRNNKWTLIHFNLGNDLSVNDIFTIYKSRDQKMWFGTGSGLIRSGKPFPLILKDLDTPDLLMNHTIHGILEDNRHNIWLSTNRGLMKYAQKGGSFATYGYSYGLNTIEYSDGAYFFDSRMNTMFFGGINGFVTVTETPYVASSYSPPILFKEVRINEKIQSVDALLKKNRLVLSHHQNFFTLIVSALDYIDGSNYSYSYKLEGYNMDWINNSNSNKISFTSLPPGDYLLHVKYHNNMTNSESPLFDLKIRILHPWYSSALAKIIYLIIFFFLLRYIVRYYFRRYKEKQFFYQQKLEQTQKEEIYESKLRFFTSIAHEMSVPLTLISGPCQQILHYDKLDAYVRNYAQIIERNVSKFNNLIQMLVKFKEIGEPDKQNDIELLSISRIFKDVSRTFYDYAEEHHISYGYEVDENLFWTSNQSDMATILNVLLSNAFRHTNPSGSVWVSIRPDGDNLLIHISNTGVGIQENIEYIFDRYHALDHFEKQSEKGIFSRGGLEIAICHDIVIRMQGQMEVKSVPNDKTEFFVRLPRLEVSERSISMEAGKEKASEKIDILPAVRKPDLDLSKNKQSMFVIIENAEIMNFVADLFSAEYHIYKFYEYKAASELLNQVIPSLFICGIMSDNADGIAFIEGVKRENPTAHVPVILLSALQQQNLQIKEIESGADVCLSLPFDSEYLKAVVKQINKRNAKLKDYYKSSLSSFELTDGKMLHKEDKQFFDKMLHIINENITDVDLSTQYIAEKMGISSRNLYRRLSEITNLTPVHIIKEYRLQIAEQMLVTTKLSIDEIIYKSGFNNRGTFFKCFASKYQCTPKLYREQKQPGMMSN